MTRADTVYSLMAFGLLKDDLPGLGIKITLDVFHYWGAMKVKTAYIN